MCLYQRSWTSGEHDADRRCCYKNSAGCTCTRRQVLHDSSFPALTRHARHFRDAKESRLWNVCSLCARRREAFHHWQAPELAPLVRNGKRRSLAPTRSCPPREPCQASFKQTRADAHLLASSSAEPFPQLQPRHRVSRSVGRLVGPGGDIVAESVGSRPAGSVIVHCQTLEGGVSNMDVGDTLCRKCPAPWHRRSCCTASDTRNTYHISRHQLKRTIRGRWTGPGPCPLAPSLP